MLSDLPKDVTSWQASQKDPRASPAPEGKVGGEVEGGPAGVVWGGGGGGKGRQLRQTFWSRTLPAASLLPPPWPGSPVGSLWAAGALDLTAACQLVP